MFSKQRKQNNLVHANYSELVRKGRTKLTKKSKSAALCRLVT
jgi:hypothetical protein